MRDYTLDHISRALSAQNLGEPRAAHIRGAFFWRVDTPLALE
jgi:hypothetical protein